VRSNKTSDSDDFFNHFFDKHSVSLDFIMS